MKMKNQNSRKGWIEEIAFKSKHSKEEVQTVIQKYEIQQNPNSGTPKHLCIQKVSFSGVKQGKHTNEFKFDFDNLSPGIYGVVSDGNLKGKTTVLEVIKWLLRGSGSSLLQDGVRSWINKAYLEFKIDEIPYLVELRQDNNEVKGGLFSLISNNKNLIGEFYSNSEFESCMSEFMIKQFSLDKISAFRKSKIKEEIGKKISHNWASLASALFISTNYSSLFGDTTADGLNNRLMNMYLGLPWFSTFTALKTTENQIKSETKVEEIHYDKEIQRKQERYQEIVKDLEEKEKLIKNIPSDKEAHKQLKNVRERYGADSRQITCLDLHLRRLSEDYETIKETKQTDTIRVINFKEDMAAHAVFKRLNPTCCPHCESQVTKEKIEKEKTDHQCAICDAPLLESEDAEILLKELESNLKASKKAYNEIHKEFNQTKDRHSQLSSNLQQLQGKINQFETALDKFSERNQVQKDITRLLILKDEYSVSENNQNKPLEKKNSIDEKKIITKAIEVTKSRFEILQKDLLKEVSDEILRISELVGLGNIEAITLSSIPTLQLEKDGSATSYSKCSAGEKLRLKVITTIALLSVAEKRSVGRHPGLLLVDSPGAQEVSDHDLNSLIEGLKKLSIELPFIQIIVASRASDVILKQFDVNHRRYAKGEDYLW